MKRYHIEKNTVQETLIIPLYGRKVCSDRFPDLFSDPEAERLICGSNDNDPERIGKQLLEMAGRLRNEQPAAVGRHRRGCAAWADDRGAGDAEESQEVLTECEKEPSLCFGSFDFFKRDCNALCNQVIANGAHELDCIVDL